MISEATSLIGSTTDQIRTREKDEGLKFKRKSDLRKSEDWFTLENFRKWEQQDLTRQDVSVITGFSSQSVGKHLKRFPEVELRFSKHYCQAKSRIAKRNGVESPARVYSGIEKLALFMPLVSNSPELRPDHGAA